MTPEFETWATVKGHRDFSKEKDDESRYRLQAINNLWHIFEDFVLALRTENAELKAKIKTLQTPEAQQ